MRAPLPSGCSVGKGEGFDCPFPHPRAEVCESQEDLFSEQPESKMVMSLQILAGKGVLGPGARLAPGKQSAPSCGTPGSRLLPPRGPTCSSGCPDVCSFVSRIRGPGEAHADGHTHVHTRKCTRTSNHKHLKHSVLFCGKALLTHTTTHLQKTRTFPWFSGSAGIFGTSCPKQTAHCLTLGESFMVA